MNDFSTEDAAKLRMLADWFDRRDREVNYPGGTEVQDDLRSIAKKIDTQVEGQWETLLN